MVRNKYYVVRKLADVIYALPVGQGIVRDYPVMQLGRWSMILCVRSIRMKIHVRYLMN